MKFEFGKKEKGVPAMQFRLDDAMVLLSLCMLAITIFYFETLAFGAISFIAIFLFRQKFRMKRFWPIIVGFPLLTLMSTYYHYDVQYFIFIIGLFITAYSFSITNRIKMEYAFMAAFLIAGIVTHVQAATISDLLHAFDPWWHWRWIDIIDTTAALPQHDYLTYPAKGGLDMTRGLFLYHVAVAGVSKLLLFYSAYEVTLLFSGVIAAFTVMVLFIGLVRLFEEEFPYNYIMAFFASFMLMMSPVFAMKAISGNAEEDAIGMLFLLSAMFLFIFSIKFKEQRYAWLSSLSFFILALTWGGFMYGVIVCGIFTVLYSLIQRFINKDCLTHVKYFVIATFPGVFLTGLLLHPTGALPEFVRPSTMVLIPWGLAVLLGTIIAYTANKQDRRLQISLGVVSVLAIIFLATFGPMNAISYVNDVFIKGARAETLVRQTIAEQGMTAADLPKFFRGTYNYFGMALYLTPISIALLGYYVFRKQSIGALFLLVWSIPMFYAAMNKTVFLFLASVPIISLGAAIALYSIGRREDLDSMRIIGTMLIIISVPLYMPLWDTATTGLNANNETVVIRDTDFNKFVGGRVFRQGPSGGIIEWSPAIQWFEDMTQPNQAVLTWWDYGHWLTSISKRPVLIDNLQADSYEIQDVAQFFTNKTTEAEAFEIVEKYQAMYLDRNMSLDHVAIDFTLIGKSQALHYIASGTVDPPTPGRRNQLSGCGLNPRISRIEPTLMPQTEGFRRESVLVFECTQSPDFWGAISFHIDSDTNEMISIGVQEFYLNNDNSVYPGPEIPWEIWQKNEDASLVGLHSFNEIIMQALQNSRTNTLKSFIYVPGAYNDYMLTKLYFAPHLQEYRALGLYNREVVPLEHFTLVQDVGYGYVRIYEITY